MTTTIQPGLHLSMPDAEYRSIAALSQSELKAFAKDPELYERQYILRDIPRGEPTPAMQLGCDVEAWLLTGSLPDVVLIPDDVLSASGTRAGKAWKAFEAEHAGMRLMKAIDQLSLIETLSGIEANVAQHSTASQLLTPPYQIHPVCVWENDHGLLCKCQLDLVNRFTSVDIDATYAVDIKTTNNASLPAFARTVDQLNYDVQAEWYREGLAACGIEITAFAFVVIEVSVNGSPTANRVECCTLSADWLALGRRKIERWLAHWLECQASGVWRSRTWGSLACISPPRWAETQMEDWG